jgi:hypothetical protein
MMILPYVFGVSESRNVIASPPQAGVAIFDAPHEIRTLGTSASFPMTFTRNTYIRRAFAAATFLCLVATGCTGHAALQIIPIGPKGLDSTSPMTVHLRPRECYYWIDAANHRICIAMRMRHRSLLGPRFHRDLTLSLILEGLPAGATLQYRADRNTLRAKLDAGYAHQRFATQFGQVLLWDYGESTLRGRFRFFTKRQSYLVLTGWGSDATVLVLGEFSAVRAPELVQKVLAATESDGMERTSLPRHPPPANDETPVDREPPAASNADQTSED